MHEQERCRPSSRHGRRHAEEQRPPVTLAPGCASAGREHVADDGARHLMRRRQPTHALHRARRSALDAASQRKPRLAGGERRSSPPTPQCQPTAIGQRPWKVHHRKAEQIRRGVCCICSGVACSACAMPGMRAGRCQWPKGPTMARQASKMTKASAALAIGDSLQDSRQRLWEWSIRALVADPIKSSRRTKDRRCLTPRYSIIRGAHSPPLIRGYSRKRLCGP